MRINIVCYNTNQVPILLSNFLVFFETLSNWREAFLTYCLFSCASELPDSGWEKGQACQNPARKDVADHG